MLFAIIGLLFCLAAGVFSQQRGMKFIDFITLIVLFSAGQAFISIALK